MLRLIIRELNKDLPTEWIIAPPRAQYEFLMAIKDVKELILSRMMERYIASQAFKDRKGLPYLKAMILSEASTSPQKVENERMKIGKSPQRLRFKKPKD